MKKNCCLVLEDGSLFPGTGFGADPDGQSRGELVFNTGMSGYHEILTDPSYTGQIVMMTYPHIGNYGSDDEWSETGPEPAGRKGIKASAMVVRSLYRGWVPPGRESLDGFMKRRGVSGISEVDTRALTIKLRDGGSCRAMIISGDGSDADAVEKAVASLRGMPSMSGMNLVGEVGTSEELLRGDGKITFAVIDCGIKANIVRELEKRGAGIRLFPSGVEAAEILGCGADAVLISNGPGDPSVLDSQIRLASDLAGKLPLFGICLGHQLISLAMGGQTEKMKFGHHGINNPVRDELTGRVMVTSQNHGFMVKRGSLPEGIREWFVNANDGTLEGIICREKCIASVQFHPEAAPGPVDSSWIFDTFIEMASGGVKNAG